MNPRNWRMEQKFLAGSLAITWTAIAVVSGFLIVSEKQMVLKARLDNTFALVGMIANNAAAALIYDDEKVARQILAGANAEPSTKVAALYDTEGKLYAWFPETVPAAALPPMPQKPQAILTGDAIDAFAAMTIEGRPAGMAFLRTDLAAMQARFDRYVRTVIAAAAAATFLVFLLSKAIQRWTVEPLISLSKTAKAIAEGNYSIRVKKESADEVGELVEAFNHMVHEVELAHQKIHNHATSLEKEVAERTAKLRETIGELEAFSYSVSHDMRSPLRAMHGYAELLLDDYGSKLDGEGSRYLTRISRNAERLEMLVRDVLAYSKVSKEEIDLAPVNLDAFLPGLVAQLSDSQLAGARISLERPLPTVMAHEAYLCQVFTNLLCNAVKFTAPDRRPEVSIESVAEDKQVEIRVRDNGIGIDPAHFGRIFEMFGRVYPEKKFEGTGIGLAIVKKAVQRMGGTIGVKSTLGSGSCFWFILKRP